VDAADPTPRRAVEPKPVDLQISVESDGDDCRARLHGELDLATAGQLNAVLSQLSPRPGQAVVLDLTDLSFCDCAGLAVLIGQQHRLRQRDVAVVIESPPRLMERLISVSGSNGELTIRRD
jgi:anti-sigma B factor antagonist